MKWIGMLLGAAVLTALGAAGAFAGATEETGMSAGDIYTESGYPVTTEKITLEMVGVIGHKTYPHEGMEFFDMVEEKTNIHVEWRQIQEEAYAEKKNLLFASGDYPDAFFMHKTLDPADILTHAPQGVFRAIEDDLAKWAPNLNRILQERPEVRLAMQAPDGHVYSMPGIWESGAEPQLHFFINKNWLDKLGLEMPQTYDEYRDVLRAFKNGDPNGNGEADEIPLSFRSFGWLGVYPLFSSFGVDRQHHIGEEMGISIDRDDPTQVIYVAATDAYREGIEYFHGLWSEGLIDIEAFSHSYAELTAKQRQLDPPVVGSFTAWSAAYLFGEGVDSGYVTMDPLEGPAGRRWPGDPPSYFLNAFTVTSASEHPQAAVRWADLQYDPEWALQSWFGIIGTHILEQGDGTYVHAEIPDGFESRISWKNQSVPRGMGIYALPVEVMRLMEPTADQLDKFAGNEQYAPYIASYARFPLVYMLEEENDEIADLAPEINQFTQEMGAKWIVDGGIDEDWDGYLQRLDSMGLPRLLEIYQNVYDRHLSD